MNNMTRQFFCIFLCLAISSAISNAQDREVEVIDGMTWYLNKKDAMDVASEQGKYVFFVWGHKSCHRCDELKKDVAWCFLQPVLSKHYILWYSDGDKYDRNSAEVSDYLSSLTGDILPQPVVCVINPSDPTIAHNLRAGAYDIDELALMLEQSVSNDYISGFENVYVYVNGNNLVIHDGFERETISVFSVTGSLIDKFNKADYSYIRNLSAYPKGVLIVTGSSGWVRKIVVN